MKKFFSIILAGLVSASALALGAAADSFNPNGGCDIAVSVKKANPANVVKDGVIGAGEYERFNVDSNSLTQTYGSNTQMIDYAEAMAETMEYYFSWDDVHGLNFAVICRPGIEIVQNFTEGTDSEKPGDDFMTNIGLQIELDYANPADRGEQGLFYYAISKNPATGAYLKGHYNQLGLTGAYNPAAGQDFVVNYPGDGSVVYEWSVPFAHFLNNAAAGSSFGFTTCAMAGSCTQDTAFQDCFGISFGDYGGFLVKMDKNNENNKQAIMTLSADEIPSGEQPDNPPADDPSNGGNTGNTGDNNNGGDNNGNAGNAGNNAGNGANTNNNGGVTPSGNNNNNTSGGSNTKAPSTGDAAVILAAVSALSACGIAFSKKRRG